MANLYTPEGTLDYAAAAGILAGAKQITNDAKRATETSLVRAAALLDIAVSLGAIVSGFATGGIWPDAPGDDDDDDEEGDDPRTDEDVDEYIDDRPLDIDDWVLPYPVWPGDGAPTDIPSRVIAVGASEGAPWVELEHHDATGSVLGAPTRAWAEGWCRVPAPFTAAEMATTVDLADLLDDIDSDFDAPTSVDDRPAKVKKNKPRGGE